MRLTGNARLIGLIMMCGVMSACSSVGDSVDRKSSDVNSDVIMAGASSGVANARLPEPEAIRDVTAVAPMVASVKPTPVIAMPQSRVAVVAAAPVIPRPVRAVPVTPKMVQKPVQRPQPVVVSKAPATQPAQPAVKYVYDFMPDPSKPLHENVYVPLAESNLPPEHIYVPLNDNYVPKKVVSNPPPVTVAKAQPRPKVAWQTARKPAPVKVVRAARVIKKPAPARRAVVKQQRVARKPAPRRVAPRAPAQPIRQAARRVVKQPNRAPARKPVYIAQKPAAKKPIPVYRAPVRKAPVRKPAPKRLPVYVASKPVQKQQIPTYYNNTNTARPAAKQVARARVQRKPVQRVAVRRAQPARRVVQPAVIRRPVQQPRQNYQAGRLTGDFAGNYLAEAFINRMSSQHGFNRSYVTGVLSKARATAWLRKMADADAHPERRKRSRTVAGWSKYRKRFLTSRHINGGVSFWKQHRNTLRRASQQFGVPEEYILGIMGVETIYGGNVGKDRAIDALATMSFMNSRRGAYFTSELEAYLLMTRRTGLDPLRPKASYAGALGLAQFMPSNIKKYGVDYDGDGAVNLWTPHDAIGSIANYLRKHGWKPGEIAAIRGVKTGSRGYRNLGTGFKRKHSLQRVVNSGIRPEYNGVSGQVSLVKLPTFSGNEYWVGGKNFYTITRYNHSNYYAMAVHQLAQAIKGRMGGGRSAPRRTLPKVYEAALDDDMMRAAQSLL